MTNATLSAGQLRNCVFARNLGEPHRMYEKQTKNAAGNDVTALVVEGKAIFRSGTFSDSMGYEHTWETLHMQQMVDHDALLRGRGLFEDIPVRRGHPDWGGLFSDPVRNPMDELVGYMSNLRTEERVNPTDGNTYTYLLADLEILEENAIKNIKSGLWRNVSAEISTYVTNGNAEYWPVMYGLAYVDIPAVEGLKSQHSKAANKYSIILEDEQMTGAPNKPQPPVPNAGGDQNGGDSHTHSIDTHSTATQPSFAFSIGGKQTSDFAAVQQHINTLESNNSALEQFKRESLEAGRVDFVKGLVKDNKIPAPQEEQWVEYAKSQTDEGFAAWRKLMEDAPVLSIAGAQGAGFSQNHEQSTEASAKEERIEILKSTVAAHQMGGKMTDDHIKATNSYKELVALDPTFSL